MQEQVDKFMSGIEKDKIIAFNSDPILVNAVKKVLLASIYSNGTLRADVPADPTRNAALALANLAISGKGIVKNEDLGEDLRGLMQGVSLLEQGLAQLAKIKKDPEGEVKPSVNEAI